MSEQKDSGSFLNRWSTRKQQSTRRVSDAGSVPGTRSDPELMDPSDSLAGVRRQGEHAGRQPVADLTPIKEVAPSGHESPAMNQSPAPAEEAPVPLTDADMPDIESLTVNSDISGFFSSGVSAALRKSALRHVFRQPGYNVRDGLDDYDDDYTSFAPLGDTVTSDMKFHAARKERARLEQIRLAQEQAAMQQDMPGNAEIAQDDTSTLHREQSSMPTEDEPVESAEGEQEESHALSESGMATTQEDAVPEAQRSSGQTPEHDTDADNPLNKTVQASALQPCETPDE